MRITKKVLGKQQEGHNNEEIEAIHVKVLALGSKVRTSLKRKGKKRRGKEAAPMEKPAYQEQCG